MANTPKKFMPGLGGGETANSAEIENNILKKLLTNPGVPSPPAHVKILTFAPTLVTNINQGKIFKITLTADMILANPTGTPYDGQIIQWELIQDAGGNRKLTLGSIFNTGGRVVTLSTNIGAVDFLTAQYRVSKNEWVVVGFIGGY